MTTTLDTLAPGSTANIADIAGRDAFRQRLLELGCLPGSTVRMLRSAPLGDPLEIEISGTRLTLRRNEAQRIGLSTARNVTVDDHSTPPGPVVQRNASSSAIANVPKSSRLRILLAGNPNSGKTTLFNQLTGASAHIENYPGTTVETHVGEMTLTDTLQVDVHDLPGMYSLTGEGQDEQCALEQLVSDKHPRPAAIVVVLNATTLARSTYLLTQLQEFGIPLIGAVNMIDEAERAGFTLDLTLMSERFHMPFLPLVARKGKGIVELKTALTNLLSESPTPTTVVWPLSPPLETNLARFAPDANRALALWSLLGTHREPAAWLPSTLQQQTANLRQHLEQTGHDIELDIIQSRYQQIDQQITGVVRRSADASAVTVTPSDRIDRVLTHPILGPIIFLVVMGTLFTALFDWATPMMDLIDSGFIGLSGAIHRLLPDGFLSDLLTDGVIRGVGSVIIFVPQIAILFTFIAILQSSGYLARAAFLVDRVMKKVGLNGKAFIPLLSGFACAVPAVMATRTMERRRDRLLTMMVLPLISCSARLPIYTLIIATLFPAEKRIFGPLSLGAALMGAIYLLSTVLAMLAAAVLGRTVLRGKRPPLLLELPPYRLPSPRRIGILVWQQVRMFLKTAGTVIVVISTVLWLLLHFPSSGHQVSSATQLENSYAGQVGQLIEPVLAPLGFDWKIGIGLIGSFAAREVFVATMGLVYGVRDADEETVGLRDALRHERRPDGTPVYTPLVGLSLLVFFMIAMQCMSTLAVVKQESRAWKWPLLMTAYLTGFAYFASLMTYQVGRALGFS